MVFSKKTRKNSSAQNIHDRTDVRKAEGKALAESPARKKWIKDNLHRMQSGVFATNMIKALEIHSWQNTVEDWQRYYETKYAQQLRRAGTKKRKNPANLHLSAKKHYSQLSPADLTKFSLSWYIFYLDTNGKYNAYEGKVKAGWKFGQSLTKAKKYVSHSVAKKTFQQIYDSITLPEDGALILATHGEALTFLKH